MQRYPTKNALKAWYLEYEQRRSLPRAYSREPKYTPAQRKNELFYARAWLDTTIDEFIAALDAYIRWYNEARIKISFGSLSPMEHRNSLGITV